MWTAILGILDGSVALFGKLMDYWSTQSIRDSGIKEEQLRSAEKTLERVRISNEVDLEPVASDKHIILGGL
jgi:hypothetical protein